MGNYPKITPIIATGSSKPRYLGDRFADIVNLKDFGAVGDGETDDSTAWAAWNAALQNGGMPFIPKGNYLLDDELVHVPKGYLFNNNNVFSYEDGLLVQPTVPTVFVDGTNGSDTSDGLTRHSAVKTIQKAVDIVSAQNQGTNPASIVIAGGSYDEDVVCRNIQADINLEDDVTINGRIDLQFGCVITIKSANDNSETLTITETNKAKLISCDSHCYLSIYCPVIVNATNSDSSFRDCILINHYSYFELASTLTIGGDHINTALYVNRYSYASVQQVTITATNVKNLFNVVRYSVCVFYGAVSGQGVGTALYVFESSLAVIGQDFTVSGQNCIYAGQESVIVVNTTAKTITLNRVQYNGTVGSIFICRDKSFIAIQNNNELVLNLGDYASENCFYVYNESMLIVDAIKTTFSGKCNINALVSSLSYFYFRNSGNAVSGSITGTRYSSRILSVINANGGGANRFPGNAAGSTSNSGLYI